MISQAMVTRTNISLAFLMLFLCAVENLSFILRHSLYLQYNLLVCLGWKRPNQVDHLLCFLTIFCTLKVCSYTFNTISFMLHNFFLKFPIFLGSAFQKMLPSDPSANWNLSSWSPVCFYCSVASFQSEGNVNSVIPPSLAPKFLFDQLHYVTL